MNIVIKLFPFINKSIFNTLNQKLKSFFRSFREYIFFKNGHLKSFILKPEILAKVAYNISNAAKLIIKNTFFSSSLFIDKLIYVIKNL